MGFAVKQAQKLRGGGWVKGNKMFVGSTTRDISLVGTQVIAGVGFRPALVIFYAVVNSTKLWSGPGFDTGIWPTTLYSQSTSVAGQCADFGGGGSIMLYSSAALYAYAKITAMDNNGFTLTWTKVGSPTGTAEVRFTAFA